MSEPNWLAVYTSPQREQMAQAALVDLGFEVYLPTRKKWRCHARKCEMVPRPLMPRYLFLRARQDWPRALRARGVEGVLMNSGAPMLVANKHVADIKAQVDAGRHDDLPGGKRAKAKKSTADFKPRDHVRITEGAFQGFEADVEAIDGDTVQVLLNLFGRATIAKVGVDILRPSAVTL